MRRRKDALTYHEYQGFLGHEKYIHVLFATEQELTSDKQNFCGHFVKMVKKLKAHFPTLHHDSDSWKKWWSQISFFPVRSLSSTKMIDSCATR